MSLSTLLLLSLVIICWGIKVRLLIILHRRMWEDRIYMHDIRVIRRVYMIREIRIHGYEVRMKVRMKVRRSVAHGWHHIMILDVWLRSMEMCVGVYLGLYRLYFILFPSDCHRCYLFLSQDLLSHCLVLKRYKAKPSTSSCCSVEDHCWICYCSILFEEFSEFMVVY